MRGSLDVCIDGVLSLWRQCSKWKISRNGMLYSPKYWSIQRAIETLELKHLANYD